MISELLEMCTKMRTTNPNKSFNSHIWRRAPKHLRLWKPTVDIVLAMAVLEFKSSVLYRCWRTSAFFLDIIVCYISHLSFRNQRKYAVRHASISTIKNRNYSKLELQIKGNLKSVFYEAGGFNN